MLCYLGPVAPKTPDAGMAAHIDDETLERYAMKQLPETEAAPVEEHLLVCHHCQDRLAEIDRLLAALRMSW